MSFICWKMINRFPAISLKNKWLFKLQKFDQQLNKLSNSQIMISQGLSVKKCMKYSSLSILITISNLKRKRSEKLFGLFFTKIKMKSLTCWGMSSDTIRTLITSSHMMNSQISVYSSILGKWQFKDCTGREPTLEERKDWWTNQNLDSPSIMHSTISVFRLWASKLRGYLERLISINQGGSPMKPIFCFWGNTLELFELTTMNARKTPIQKNNQ